MIYKLCLGDVQENCYIITNSKNQCVIIDAGEEFEKIKGFVDRNNLKICGILLTHGHFDHCASCKKFQDLGVKIYIHKDDADKLCTNNNLAYLFGRSFAKLNADVEFDEGELKVGEFDFKVIYTPGHSKGSVAFVYKNNIFVGDTIFYNGVGRTDFYDGSEEQLIKSIQKLKPYLNGDYKIFYGH